MKKVGIISLGCAKNLVDSENILGLLDVNSYEVTLDPNDADIIVINTCGFISDSKKESINTILEMANYHKKLVVTGCLVERYLDELKKELPEVDLFIPIRDYYRFNELLSSLDCEVDTSLGVSDLYRTVSTGKYSCYLKIGEGCSNCCTYCAIPLIRGSYVSRDFDSIIEEAKKLAKLGYKEITLLEQDTTKYGSDFDNDITIVTLLKELLKIKEFNFIRLLYLYPDEISDELIELITKEDRICSYFDIPIQHSEDHILKDMNRRGNKELLRTLFKKIRDINPLAVIRTTVMVGFPNETEEDVDNLISFIKEVGFDHIGVFTYSKEEGTVSYKYKNQIPKKIKDKRKDKVMKVAQSISYKRNKLRIGEVMSAIVLYKDNDYYLVRSYFNAPDDVDGKIFVKSNQIHNEGDIINIKITDAYVYDLLAEEI